MTPLRLRPLELLPWLVVLLWTAIMVAGFHPGIMSSDSLSQWAEGLSWRFSNWHPPFVALLSGLAARTWGTPTPLLVLQLLGLGSGFASLVWRRPVSSSAFLAILLALPPVWAIGVTQWKDVVLASFLMLAIAALDRRRTVAAVLLLTCATLARHNGITAVMPLAVIAALQLAPGTARIPWRALGLSVALLVAMALSPSLLERVMNAKDTWTVGSVLANDLAGIYAERPELLPDSVFAGEVGPEELRAQFTTLGVGPLFWRTDGMRHIDLASLAPRRQAITAEWLRVIPANLPIYLRHRLGTLRTLLDIGVSDVCSPYWPIMDVNPYGFALPETRLNRQLLHWRHVTRNSLVFRSWAWLVLAAAVCLVALRPSRRHPLALAAGLSSLLYAAPYFFVATTCDLRLTYWSLIGALAGVFLLLQGPRLSAAPSSAPGRAAS